MRSKALLLGSTAVVLTCALLGGATYALFSAQTGNANNSFTAGTLSIANSDQTAWSANYANMAPGDTVQKEITVSNTGSLELEFTTGVSTAGALFTGTGKASVAVTNGTGTLLPGATQAVHTAVSLPLSAGNTYQGTTGTLNLTFYAYQTKNVTTKAVTFTHTGTAGTWNVYKLYDGATLIPLNQSAIIAFTEYRPDGTTNSFAVDNSSDPNFYHAMSKPSGTYSYVIMGLNGIRYTATIVVP
jgi:spore coat-associated protein N